MTHEITEDYLEGGGSPTEPYKLTRVRLITSKIVLLRKFLVGLDGFIMALYGKMITKLQDTAIVLFHIVF